MGAAAPAYCAVGSFYLGSKFLNVGIDFTSQMITNGGDFSKLNATSLGASFFLNNTTSWRGLLLKNTISNGFQYNIEDGYRGFLGKDVDNKNIFYNIGLGTVFDKGVSALQNLDKGVTPAALGRWKNLSYKPKYNLMLQQYQRNQNIKGFFNSQFGQIITGAFGNLISKEAGYKNP